MMEFSDDDVEEEKEELSNEFVAALKENHCFRIARRRVTPCGL
jgi:hypothetical protein